MAVKRFCDRCNSEVKNGYEFWRLEVTADRDNYDSVNKELCASCRRSLSDWMKPPATTG